MRYLAKIYCTDTRKVEMWGRLQKGESLTSIV